METEGTVQGRRLSIIYAAIYLVEINYHLKKFRCLIWSQVQIGWEGKGSASTDAVRSHSSNIGHWIGSVRRAPFKEQDFFLLTL